MASQTNEFGQPIGFPLGFTGPWPHPQGIPLEGRTCRLERTMPEHAGGLFDSFSHDHYGQNWTYMPINPTLDFAKFETWFLSICLSEELLFYTVFDRDQQAIGIAAYLRVNPSMGSIEVGWISMSPLMQRTVVSTEAMYLMMHHVFEDLGYRRYEWKCDSLNAPSRATAQRLGFQFEGIFRQCVHYKSRNRDTAWFAVIDADWPALKARFSTYLDLTNFDSHGRQIRRLSDF